MGRKRGGGRARLFYSPGDDHFLSNSCPGHPAIPGGDNRAMEMGVGNIWLGKL